MDNYPYPIIAREGWIFLAFAFALAVLAMGFASLAWSMPFWALFIFFLLHFRDPGRVIPQQENVVVAPADGRIVMIGNACDPHTGHEVVKICIRIHAWNVHSNRAPVDGRVDLLAYRAGRITCRKSGGIAVESERNAMVMVAANGAFVTTVQVAGIVARSISCYVKTGDVLTRGQRYGFIRFSGEMEIYVPTGAEIKVAIGDKVRATETILARL